MERMNTLGQRIRELRLKKGLTQIDLAKGLCTPSMISQIESDRARPSYKMLFSIGERLDVSIDKLLVDVDLNLEYLSTYRMARAMVKGKEYAAAIPLLRELLDAPRAQISSMDILFELGECYLYTGHIEDADNTFNQVHELAILRQDTLLLAQVLKNFGQIAFERKKYQLASFQWQKALEELEKLDEKDVYLQAEILFQLGEAHLKTGYAKEAVQYFDHAGLVYGNQDSLHGMGHTFMALGMAYKTMNEYQKAADYSERAAAIFETLDKMLVTTKIQVTNASLLIEADLLEEAEHLLHAAIAKLKELGDKESEGMAYTELAHLYERKGELEQAEESCRTVRSLLPELHLYQAKSNRILARIELKRENVKESIRRLQMAADGFKMTDEIREWDDTMFELSRLYMQENDLHRVIRILEDMRAHTHCALAERGIEL